MQKKRILVVEDNEIQRDMLCDILDNDYQVLEAGNGKEALEILDQENISLVLLDIKMPVMDGYAFLNCMREDARFVNIPVIVLTMPDNEDDEIRALEHGATDYMTKPYKPAVMLHRVAGLIHLQETNATGEAVLYDKLTGLYTKEAFYSKVRGHLDENPDIEYTILCSNLENFRLYNDIFGWKAGDKLLVQVAHTLRDRIGENGLERMAFVVDIVRTGFCFFWNLHWRKRDVRVFLKEEKQDGPSIQIMLLRR